MSTVEGGGNIVTDGLVLYLDAANTKSYVSGSTTWNDISRGGNNGTLVNGPTFSSVNLGNIAFDGVDDYVQIPNSNYLTLGNFTVTSWAIRTTGNTTSFRLVANGADSDSLTTPGFFLGATSLNCVFSINPTGVRTSLTTPITAGIFTCMTGVYDGSGNMGIYINGQPKTFVSSPTGSTVSNKGIYIGCRTVNDLFWPGNVASVQIYNRVLSATEVLQNYNATKSRFGL
jgi:hypothetical protein